MVLFFCQNQADRFGPPLSRPPFFPDFAPLRLRYAQPPLHKIGEKRNYRKTVTPAFSALERLTTFDYARAYGVSEVLFTKGIGPEDGIPEDLMERAYTLSQRVWKAMVFESEETSRSGLSDWLTVAVNRPGGKFAQFWLEYLSILKKTYGDRWTGLPANICSDLSSVVSEKSESAGLAQVVFASRLHFLFYLDPTFAQSQILPLLDWKSDNSRAEQCWCGYLCSGRWQRAFLDQMLPFYEQTLYQIKLFSGRHGDSFAAHIASIAVFGVDDPLKNGWLLRYIAQFESGIRAHFAEIIWQLLGQMEADPRSNLWRRWLCRYWSDRNAGKPVPLAEEEIQWMRLWPLHLGEHFSASVQLLLRSGSPKLQRNFSQEEFELVRRHIEKAPEASADYLIWTFLTMGRLYEDGKAAEFVQMLEERSVSPCKISELRDELLRLGGGSE